MSFQSVRILKGEGVERRSEIHSKLVHVEGDRTYPPL